MKRFLYRCVIALHPRAFRERFGDEMLSVFDEATHAQAAAFFMDGVGSLARRWLLRSGLWKLAIGATASGLLLGMLLGGEARWERQQAMRALAAEKTPVPLDEAQFHQDTAAAIAMLASFREGDKRKSHKHGASKPIAASPDASQD
jgi:hypothetical protein